MIRSAVPLQAFPRFTENSWVKSPAYRKFQVDSWNLIDLHQGLTGYLTFHLRHGIYTKEFPRNGPEKSIAQSSACHAVLKVKINRLREEDLQFALEPDFDRPAPSINAVPTFFWSSSPLPPGYSLFCKRL